MVTSALQPEQFKKIAFRNTTLPFAICIVISALFIALVWHLIGVLRLVDHTNRVLARAHFTAQVALDAQNGLRGYVITMDNDFKEPYTKYKDLLIQEWSALEQMVNDNPVQVRRVQEIKKAQEDWLRFADEVLSKKTQEGMIERQKIADGRAHMQKIRNVLQEVVQVEEDLLETRSSEAKSMVSIALTIITILGIITGSFLAYFSRKQLHTVSKSYADALEEVALHNLELEKQDWLKSLQVEITSQARGINNLKEICSSTLSKLCHILDARVGAMYLVDNQHLKLAAGHAVSGEDAKAKEVLDFGEGILGQSAKEMKVMRVDTPSSYLKINSALGETAPTTILALPLIANDQTIAMIELAFTKTVSESDIEIAETLATTASQILSSAKYTHRIQELLEESRRAAQELQAQQEELKTTNEELEQQTHILKETHFKLQSQQTELEQTNQQLEEQTQALESQAKTLNDKNTELLALQDNLKDKARELQISSQYKSEFLANMSHELRTPLNSSLILAKLLSENKQGNLTEEQVKFANIIYTSGNDLLNLINDVLDLSKVEAGKMTISPENFQLKDIFRDLELIFTPVAKDRGLQFNVKSDAVNQVTINTDRMRLEQILKNFLSNALKFTQKGSVTLAARQEKNGVAIEVTDTGIGIPEEQQQTIFEAFTQADGTTNRKYGGTGLGLSISRELSRILGADISVKSTPGKGSTFTLHLPLVFTPQTATESIVEILPKPVLPKRETPVPEQEIVKFSFEDDRDTIEKFNRRMLIIEDDENFAKILFDLAHEMSFGAVVAPTAEEGLRLTQLTSPQAIVLDIRLPDHSGMVVLDQLKMQPKTRHIPVHVISNEDFSEDAMAMGAIGYMLKPVKREELTNAFSTLSTLMGKKQKTVLVVEDDQVQREHIGRLVADPNVTIESVETAGEALKHLAKKTYDCMIMDLSLPDMSGHELLEKLIQVDSPYSYPPVIVYTARDLTREEEERLRQYSKSIIIKGAKSPERLLSEVTLFLHRVENELPLEQQKMLKELRSRDKTLDKKNILMVDDDIRNIFSLTAALEQYGAVITPARNGHEALSKLEIMESVDLVLMDIMMPEMDGYEAMRRIRLEKKYASLPIIALTAKAMKDDQEKCLAAGANDYLSKPINVDKLLSLIRVWLPTKRSFNS